MQDNPLIQRVARSVHQEPLLVEFPWATVLGIALQVAEYVIKCYMNKTPADETPQELVAKRYVDGKYDARLLASMTRRVHSAARRQGVRLSRDQGRIFAARALDEIRLGTADEVRTACSLLG